jgi:tetratricopeptide (TPR) repeat protein
MVEPARRQRLAVKSAGELRVALEQTLQAWRRLGEPIRVAQGVNSLGYAYRMLGDTAAARRAFEESIAIAREQHSAERLSKALSNLAQVEIDTEQPQRAIPLLDEAIELDRQLGDRSALAVAEGNLAAATAAAGRPRDAYQLLCSVVADAVTLGDVELIADTLERFAAVAAQLGADLRAARLCGAAQRIRKSAGIPLSGPDQVLLERAIGAARERIGPQIWERECSAGGELTQAQAVALAREPLE